MSDDDNVSKLIILTLGIGAICFFAYLIFREHKGYHVGMGGGNHQMSLADDEYFQLERKLHQLEMDNTVKLSSTPGTPGIGTEGYVEHPSAPAPRKIVKMKQMPNISNLSKADQDKIRRMFFNML